MTAGRPTKIAGKKRILDFFLAHIGEVVSTHQVREVAGIADYQRRIRDLRKEGWRIESDKDREGLRPGEYVLASDLQAIVSAHAIPSAVRRKVLIRDGHTCQMCGAGPGEPHPEIASRRVRLQVDHIDPRGSSTAENLRTICSACHEGRANIETPPPEVLNALAIIRRAPRHVQLDVLRFLRRKYPNERQASE